MTGSTRSTIAAVAQLVLAATCTPAIAQDLSLTAPIDAAIDAGVRHLGSNQHRDGSWTGRHFRSYRAGPTAFAAYALVESGVPPSDPSIQTALDYLRRTPPTMTYSAGAVLLLVAEIGGRENLDLAQRSLDLLLEWESDSIRGAWSYPSGPIDLSNTQFVALGLWSAHRLGLDVPIPVCQRMLATTIDAHQEDATDAQREHPDDGRRRPKMAGFTYFMDRPEPPRASMTVAGVCIQRIAREIHGRRLGNRNLRASDASEALGLRWLYEHWDPRINHGAKEGEEQTLYYLWGIERLGALLDRDELFGVDWYVAGAEVILEAQEEHGGWKSDHETAYALLFLNRATGRTPVTGGAPVQDPGLVVRSKAGDVQFAVSGSMELTMWLEDIVAPEPNVERVEWLVGGEVIATVEGDPAQRWDGERYATQFDPGLAGEHQISARVTLAGSAAQLTSETLTVTTRWSPRDWMRAARAATGHNLLAEREVAISASSEAPGQPADRAVDGLEGTAWIAAADDAEPRVELTFGRAIAARALTLSHAASSPNTLPLFAGATRVRVTINGKAPFEAEMAAQSPGPIIVDLPKKLRVRSLTIEIVDVDSGPADKRGFAEIGLRE